MLLPPLLQPLIDWLIFVYEKSLRQPFECSSHWFYMDCSYWSSRLFISCRLFHDSADNRLTQSHVRAQGHYQHKWVVEEEETRTVFLFLHDGVKWSLCALFISDQKCFQIFMTWESRWHAASRHELKGHQLSDSTCTAQHLWILNTVTCSIFFGRFPVAMSFSFFNSLSSHIFLFPRLHNVMLHCLRSLSDAHAMVVYLFPQIP